MTLSKEKIVSLTKHLVATQDKLSAQIPDKHKDHPESYKQFLLREIESTKTKLDAAKLESNLK